MLRLEEVRIPAQSVFLGGDLDLPANARAVVAFAHGSGSSRFSQRNRFVAREFQTAGIGTLLFDLLTPEEDSVSATRFDIDLLTTRLAHAIEWLRNLQELQECSIGLFGASTGAAAALKAAAIPNMNIQAVVSRGGRPDLAGKDLASVRCPTLLIVGGRDYDVLHLNREASKQLKCKKKLEVVPGATHLFEEPGALEEVARLAVDWCARYL
jgi:pimeloyl-ACP methyl ester carboxylesterase